MILSMYNQYLSDEIVFVERLKDPRKSKQNKMKMLFMSIWYTLLDVLNQSKHDYSEIIYLRESSSDVFKNRVNGIL